MVGWLIGFGPQQYCFEGIFMSIVASLKKIASGVLRTSNEAHVKTYLPIVTQVNALEAGMRSKSDDELRERSEQLRQQAKESNGSRQHQGGGLCISA